MFSSYYENLTNDDKYKFGYNRFFKEPDSEIDFDDYGDKAKSSLYMIRKDINHCLDKDVKNYQAMWACTALILTGIDFLSQFYFGKVTNIDKKSETNILFTQFCNEFSITKNKYNPNIESNPLYYLRNSFLHNYGLKSSTKNSTKKKNYYFNVFNVANPDIPVLNFHAENKQKAIKYFNVNLWSLKEVFIQSIYSYKNKLDDNECGLRKKFVHTQNYYGFVLSSDEIPYLNSEIVTISASSILNNSNMSIIKNSSGSYVNTGRN